MRVVVADTSPINYLVLTGYVGVLAVLFKRVILPSVVREELEAAPPMVRVRVSSHSGEDSLTESLDAGEADAISLALEIGADLVLMDDRAGVLAGRRNGLTVIGTLGILGLAAQEGLIRLPEAFERIRKTNFRYRQEIMDRLLAEAERNS